jgi:hypothetical protein
VGGGDGLNGAKTRQEGAHVSAHLEESGAFRSTPLPPGLNTAPIFPESAHRAHNHVWWQVPPHSILLNVETLHEHLKEMHYY